MDAILPADRALQPKTGGAAKSKCRWRNVLGRERECECAGCLESVSLLCAVDGVADVGAGQGQSEEDKLDEEPGPAAAVGVAGDAAGRLAGLGGAGAGGLARVALVQVEGLDGDNVEVVRQLAGFGAEAQVCDGGDFEVGDVEAGCEVVFGLVLQLELEERVLEVGQAGLCGDLGVADSTGLVLLAWR